MSDPREESPIISFWAREAVNKLNSILFTIKRDGFDAQSRSEIKRWAKEAREYARWIEEEIVKPEIRNEFGEPL